MMNLFEDKRITPRATLELYRVSMSSPEFKYLFCRSYDAMLASGHSVSRDNYTPILVEYLSGSETPDEIYDHLCLAFEAGLVEHKICISDVIVIKSEKKSAYYVDLSGFVDVTGVFDIEK